MTKDNIQDWDATAANNTDIGGVNIAEDCAPSGINNAIRELMAQIKAAIGTEVQAYDATDLAKIFAFGRVTNGNFTVGFDTGCTVTRASTGVYTFTFDTAQPDTNYLFQAISHTSVTAMRYGSRSTTAAQMVCFSTSTGTPTDSGFDFSFFRARS